MSSSTHDTHSAGDGLGGLLQHEYDGIREYDNPTPFWWHAIFIGSVFFAVIYFTYYHFNPDAATIQKDWLREKTLEDKKIFGKLGELKPDIATMQRLMADANIMNVAAGTFQANCSACHAKDGGGINGVNLCDDAYKNVKEMPDIIDVITKGRANGAMPAWENRLSLNERILMGAYVASLRGTKPAAPKAPEGQVIPPWPAATK